MPDDFERKLDAWGRAEATTMGKRPVLPPNARFLMEVQRVRMLRKLVLASAISIVAIIMILLIVWAITATQPTTPPPQRNDLNDPPLRAIDR